MLCTDLARCHEARDLPSQAYLHECLLFNSLSGVFTWKRRPLTHFSSEGRMRIWNTKHSGKIAGCRMGSGWVIRLNDTPYQAHRIAWAMINGVPDSRLCIDHINGIRSDNRISNLRLATHSQNMWNAGKQERNSSGFKGVIHIKRRGKWAASIGYLGGSIFLGHHDTPEEAHEAYCMASEHLHGDFSRPS